jgi:hypothetical protein
MLNLKLEKLKILVSDKVLKQLKDQDSNYDDVIIYSNELNMLISIAFIIFINLNQ